MQNLKTAFQHKHILIIGDVMIDRYLGGKVNRISPEAPVPVVALQAEENKLGGAANVALNIKSLGAIPHLVSIIGSGEEAQVFKSLLESNDISSLGIVNDANRITTVKTRVIAGGQHLLRIDKEIKDAITKEMEDFLIDRVKELVNQHPIATILFQDYNKGVLTPRLIAAIQVVAQSRGIPSIVDPKFDHFFEYKGVDLFKPNLKEIQQVSPFKVEVTLESLTKAAQFIEEKIQNRITMITLSEHGVFYKNGEATAIIPTSPRSIADVCGAGDAVISIAALGIASNIPIHKIAQLSNIAGGLVCEAIGVVPVEIDKVVQEFES